jgi:hypothetical protein
MWKGISWEDLLAIFSLDISLILKSIRSLKCGLELL